MKVNTFVLLFVSQAINVTVYCREYVYKNDPGLNEAWYKFYHSRNDTLHMDIWLKNIEPGVTAAIDIDSDTPTKEVSPYRTDGRQQYFLVKMLLLNETATFVYIKMCLSSYCIWKKLAEGVVGETKSLVKDVCLRDLPCIVVVDLKDEPTELKTLRNPKLIKPLTVASNNLRPDTASFSNDATTVIISVVCTAGFILLVVGIRKRCWCKCEAGISQPRTNHFINRFYVNLLFREECDAEIREIEQHKYEEIEQQYEEII